MRILFTTHQFFPHYDVGTEVLTLSVARELIRRGHSVHIFTGHPSSVDVLEENRFDEYDFEGVHVYRFHHAYTPMAGQVSMIEIGYDNQLAANFFAQILTRFKPDVVHFFHLNRLGTGLIERAVLAGTPAFLTPTDFWTVCPTGQLVFNDGRLCSGPSAYAGNCVKHIAQNTKKGLVGKVAQWLPVVFADTLVRLTRSGVMPQYPLQVEVQAISSRLSTNIARLNQLRKIVSPSSFMTQKLIQHGVKSNLIIQSAYGIDMPVQEADILRRPSHQPIRIGFVGTLAPHKGCHVLIDAFNKLPQGQASLSIFGNTGELPEYFSELKRLADNKADIEFCGTFHNSKIGEVLANLDVLVVPSLWFENTPLVIYSAQAARCPVLASNFPGISEIIRDEINGLLFEAGNSAELTKQLFRLINEPELVRRLSANFQPPKSIASYVDDLLTTWAEK